jgi:MFS family permease
MPAATILLICSVFFLGGLVSLWFGTHLDKLGSKPVMAFSSLLWLGILTTWALIAGKFLSPLPVIILVLEFLMGLGAALFSMANVRLTMVISPERGRTHFFALYSVVANASLGLAPIVWGILIDLFRDVNFYWNGLFWNRYTFFFVGALLVFALTLVMKFRLEEKAAGKVEDLMRELLLNAPQRLFAKLWPF